MDQLQELLTIMMEECGELIQECSKAIRMDNYYNNKDLAREVGDVYTMIELLHEYDLIGWDEVEERMQIKKDNLKQWSNLL